MKRNGTTMEQERLWEQAMKNETLAGECLTRIHTAPDAETALRDVLRHLGETLECDRVYVFEELDRLHISNTYEWLKSGISSGIEQLPYVEKKDLEPWYHELNAGRQIILEDIETIRLDEPLIYAFLIPQGIRSIILSPLLSEGRMHGLLGADNPPPEKMAHISVLFGVLSNFISGLVNQRELKKLRMERLPRPREPAAPRFKGKRVLLVDDSREILRLNQRVLKPEGYELLIASTLREAGELLEQSALDAMVLDVDLPDGDGIDFCRKLRETSDVPVIFLTGHAELARKREGLEAGGAAFLTKPYCVHELRDAVAAAVSRPRHREAD